MAEIYLTSDAEIFLSNSGPGNQQSLARAVDLIQDDEFRDSSKVDVRLRTDGGAVYMCVIGRSRVFFVERADTSVWVIHLSLISRFRSDLNEPTI